MNDDLKTTPIRPTGGNLGGKPDGKQATNICDVSSNDIELNNAIYEMQDVITHITSLLTRIMSPEEKVINPPDHQHQSLRELLTDGPGIIRNNNSTLHRFIDELESALFT